MNFGAVVHHQSPKDSQPETHRYYWKGCLEFGQPFTDDYYRVWFTLHDLHTSSSSSSVSSRKGGGMDGAAGGGVGLVAVVEVSSNFCFLDFGPGRYFGTSGSGAGEVCLAGGCGSKGSEIPAKGSPPSLATWQSSSSNSLCKETKKLQLWILPPQHHYQALAE